MMHKIKYYWHNLFYKILCYYRNLELARYSAVISKSKVLNLKEFERFKRIHNQNNSTIFCNDSFNNSSQVVSIIDISHHLYDSIVFVTTSNSKKTQHEHSLDYYYDLVTMYAVDNNALVVCDSDYVAKRQKSSIHTLAKERSYSKRKYIAELLYDLLT